MHVCVCACALLTLYNQSNDGNGFPFAWQFKVTNEPMTAVVLAGAWLMTGRAEGI